MRRFLNGLLLGDHCPMNVKKILAKPTKETAAKESCSIWGWGTTENKNEFPNKLRKGKVDILTADQCINWTHTSDQKGWKKGDFHQKVSHNL